MVVGYSPGEATIRTTWGQNQSSRTRELDSYPKRKGCWGWSRGSGAAETSCRFSTSLLPFTLPSKHSIILIIYYEKKMTFSCTFCYPNKPKVNNHKKLERQRVCPIQLGWFEFPSFFSKPKTIDSNGFLFVSIVLYMKKHAGKKIRKKIGFPRTENAILSDSKFSIWLGTKKIKLNGLLLHVHLLLDRWNKYRMIHWESQLTQLVIILIIHIQCVFICICSFYHTRSVVKYFDRGWKNEFFFASYFKTSLMKNKVKIEQIHSGPDYILYSEKLKF